MIVWTLCEFDIAMNPSEVARSSQPAREIADVYGFVDHAGDTGLCWEAKRSGPTPPRPA